VKHKHQLHHHYEQSCSLANHWTLWQVRWL